MKCNQYILLSTLSILTVLLGSCNATITIDDDDSSEEKPVEVMLVSDHTLPSHLNLASGGAEGKERLYIDPTLKRLNEIFTARGITSRVVNVEDYAPGNNIQDKDTFDRAYARYDEVLQQAVADKTTILSVHYDANVIYDATNPSVITYTGGAQVILDERAVSPQTLALATSLIQDYKLLESLNQTGLRIRPEYDDQIRYQNNLTLNIIGHSEGGGLLLEIGAQEQAEQLFGDPEAIVSAIEIPLNILVEGVISHRSKIDN